MEVGQGPNWGCSAKENKSIYVGRPESKDRLVINKMNIIKNCILHRYLSIYLCTYISIYLSIYGSTALC
jgi:hypothetical protein